MTNTELFWVALILLLITLGAERTEAGEYKPAQQVIVSGLIIADWLQTREIARSDEFYETNPILGRHPSQSEVNQYFLACLVGYNLLTYHLKPEGAKWFSLAIGISQANTVQQNLSLGIEIKF